MPNSFSKKFTRVPQIPLKEMFREVGRNAYVDWLLILGLTTLITIGLVGVGAYLYFQISTGKYYAGEMNQSISDNTFDEKDLKTVIDRFLVKEMRTSKMGYSGPPDPSL